MLYYRPCRNKQNRADAKNDVHAGITMGVEATKPTKPEKGLIVKHRTNYSECPRYALTGDLKSTSAWPRMNIEYVYK